MRFLYSICIYLAASIAYVLSFLNPKFRKWFAARKQIIQSKQSKKKILIHCASHGEYEQIKLLSKTLKEKGFYITLSFFSLSGQDVIKKEKEFFDEIVFLPLDIKSKMLAFIQAIKPDLFIFNKYEYWYNLLQVLKQEKIPFIFINVNTSEDSKYFKWPLKTLHKEILNAECFFVHNQKTKSALNKFGVENSKIYDAPDSRISSVIHEKKRNIRFKKFETLNKEIIIYGSVHKNDLDAILSGIQSFPNHYHLVVPHDIGIESMKYFKQHLPKDYSLIDDEKYDSNIILVDKLGVLKHLYKYAKLAYVGGGFSNSQHNTLEAIIEGVVVIGGPHSSGFEELEYFNKSMYYTIQEAGAFGDTAKPLLSEGIARKHQEKIETYFNKRSSLAQIVENIDELTQFKY